MIEMVTFPDSDMGAAPDYASTMHERFAVAFRNGPAKGAGALEVEPDGLRLQGRAHSDDFDLEIPFSELTEVYVGRSPGERLNGHHTLVLERRNQTAVQVAPLGMALLPEITDLIFSLTQARPAAANVLAVAVPLKPGSLDRARQLLAKGPPLDPALLGLDGHEVFLNDEEALFVFHGADAHRRLSEAAHHPAVWRAGFAWQRCFAGPPHIVDPAEHTVRGAPAYRWTAPAQ